MERYADELADDSAAAVSAAVRCESRSQRVPRVYSEATPVVQVLSRFRTLRLPTVPATPSPLPPSSLSSKPSSVSSQAGTPRCPKLQNRLHETSRRRPEASGAAAAKRCRTRHS